MSATPEEERDRRRNQARWERYQREWRWLEERHRLGPYELGRQLVDGVCQCPVCQVVRQMDEREAGDATA